MDNSEGNQVLGLQSWLQNANPEKKLFRVSQKDNVIITNGCLCIPAQQQ
jgi:hypothetical protein